MKVAAGVLVSMTGLCLSEEYTWWGYVDRTLCVVRGVGSAAIPRLRPGLARVSRRRPSSSVRPGRSRGAAPAFHAALDCGRARQAWVKVRHPCDGGGLVARIEPIPIDRADGKARALLDELVQRGGGPGPMVRAMANPPTPLRRYLDLTRAMKRTHLDR